MQPRDADRRPTQRRPTGDHRPIASVRPSNDLADRFWESILELDPTTATMYGDERYADRLEDPGPERPGEGARG